MTRRTFSCAATLVAFALVFATAAQTVYPTGTTIPGGFRSSRFPHRVA